MSIQAVSASTVPAAIRPETVAQQASGARARSVQYHAEQAPDQVVVSEQAKALASRSIGDPQPQLQLSFAKLRELVTAPEQQNPPESARG